MRRAPAVVWLAATCALLSACEDDTPTTCAAPEGSSATCEQACTKLFELDCRITPTVEECVTTCVDSSASIDPAVTARVRACYAQATSCAEVDGCSLTCGAGGGPVPFPRADAAATDGSAPLDAGSADAGDGMDAGGSASDAGTDSGSTDDSGSPGGDAGTPAVDGG